MEKTSPKSYGSGENFIKRAIDWKNFIATRQVRDIIQRKIYHQTIGWRMIQLPSSKLTRTLSPSCKPERTSSPSYRLEKTSSSSSYKLEITSSSSYRLERTSSPNTLSLGRKLEKKTLAPSYRLKNTSSSSCKLERTLLLSYRLERTSSPERTSLPSCELKRTSPPSNRSENLIIEQLIKETSSLTLQAGENQIIQLQTEEIFIDAELCIGENFGTETLYVAPVSGVQ